MHKWDSVGTLTMQTAMVDDVIFGSRAGDGVDWGEVIKIDTQATEHEILNGRPRDAPRARGRGPCRRSGFAGL
jgi:hypothetical protein